ncbi:MAG: biotin--[acetyl-CoA-carboxylase] ligase [Myxococcota bacterium]
MFARKHLAECDSTNAVALTWADNGAPHKSLVTCDSQTHGKGRGGRIWSHYLGGLACSFILRPKIEIHQVSQITLVTAAALLQAFESLHLNALVKWPNDLLLPDSRKFAGILTEAHSTANIIDVVIVGIGLNVQRLVGSPPEYGFLSDIGYMGNKSDLLESILDSLEFHFDHLDRAGHFSFCLNYLKGRSATLGKAVAGGIALDFNSDGSLLVQDAQGKVSTLY